MVVGHPGGLGQSEDLGTVEPPPAGEVDVFDHRVGAQLGRAQVALPAPVLPLGHLPVDQQPEPLVEAEGLTGSALVLFEKSLRHGVELQGVEALEGLVVEHGRYLLHW